MNRIAHISINYDLNASSGIINSSKSKLNALKKLNVHNYDFYLINDLVEGVDGGVKLVKLNYNNFIFKYYDKLFNKVNQIRQTINLINYDIIIIRYPFADKSILNLVKNHKVYFEFHSSTKSSLDSYFKHDHPNPILMKINGCIRSILENIYSKIIYENALGFISVTNEIKNIESNQSNNKNFKIISNGINTELFKTSKFKKYDGKSLNMIMISSTESYWHGIERLVESVDKYKGNLYVNFYIVGQFPINKYHFQNPKNKIIFMGKLNENEVSNLINEMHLGVGTLGLYKKDMNEAAALKVREYVSRGIPFIKAYYDNDIDNIPELSPYFLNFPNDDSLIDINKIDEFLTRLSKCELDIPNIMHNIAVEKLDWTVKMKEYVKFIDKVE